MALSRSEFRRVYSVENDEMFEDQRNSEQASLKNNKGAASQQAASIALSETAGLLTYSVQYASQFEPERAGLYKSTQKRVRMDHGPR